MSQLGSDLSPLTANETVVFDALALAFPTVPASTISEVTGLDEFRTERALRSLAARNPAGGSTRLARLQWRLAC